MYYYICEMKRTLAILVCFMLVPGIHIVAQNVNVFDDDTKNKSFFGVNAGISIPTGSYGTTDNNNDVGFALPGPGIAAEGVYFFSKFFGVGARVDYSRHFVAKAKMVEINKRYLPEGSKYNVETTGNYEIATLLFGIYTTMGLTSWLQINGKALYGPHFVWLPQFSFDYNHEYQFNGQTLVDDWQEVHKAANNWQFGSLVGLGLRFNPSQTWAFNVNFDYADSYHTIQFFSEEHGVIYDEIGNPIVGMGEQANTLKQNFRYMTISAGFSIFL